MRITLEEIVTELKANYGLEEWARSINPASFQPIFGFKFKDREPVNIDNLLSMIEDFIHYDEACELLGLPPSGFAPLTKQENIKEICLLISRTEQ